jgi:hypothetical protein
MRYKKKAIDRILRLTAGHPFFTQAMCLQIIEDLNDKQENKVTVDHVEKACQEIVENAPFHLSFVWSELTSDEKIVIASLADVVTNGTNYASANELVSRLSYYELKYDCATVSKTLARLMENHLVERKPESESYRFQMDLIRAWVRVEHPTWGVLKEVKVNE